MLSSSASVHSTDPLETGQAVFQSLCSPDFLSHTQLPPGILLTGKGYPDLSTRELVHRLASSYASCVSFHSSRALSN